MSKSMFYSDFLDASELGESEGDLLSASFAVTTFAKYSSMWRRFMEFILDMGLDFSDVAVAKYVAYLFESGLKHNTIQCHLVAISHGLCAKKLPDTTKSYLVARMVLGAKKLTFSKDIRKPFTEQMIISIVKALPYLVFSSYEIHLYWAVFAWAFGAGLRVSEYT